MKKFVTITRLYQLHDVYQYDEAELAEQERLRAARAGEFYPADWFQNQTYVGFWIGESDSGITDVREGEGPEQASMDNALFYWNSAIKRLVGKPQLEQVCEAVLIMGDNQDGAGI